MIVTARIHVLWLLALGLVLGAPLYGQQEPSPRNEAMQRLAQQLEEIDRQLADQRAPGADASVVQSLQQQKKTLETEFAALATGFDVQRIETPTEQQYDLQTELMRLVRPLVRAISAATEAPRQIQELQEHLETVQARLQQAELVRSGLAQACIDARNERQPQAVCDRLDRQAQRWEALVADLRSDRLVTQGRLQALQQQRASVTTTVQDAVAGFFERRGLSLLIAGIAGLAVWLTVRLLHRQAMRALGRVRMGWPLRVLDLLLQSCAGLGVAVAVLLVFYLRGDFELLALTIVFLLGLGWALSRALPLFFDQLRLLLNAGAVREGERLLVDGLPFRVEVLRLYSTLVNPWLTGGELRVPLKDLVGRSSRPFAPDEPWFPTRAGDWVRLQDGGFGQVELQTPEQVVLAAEAGRRTLRAVDFLQQNPTNLSAGFQLMVTMGVDYALQNRSTDEVPERMAAALRQRLSAVPGGEHCQQVRVEFAQAGSSSLDLEARVLFGGAAAANYGVLRRAIARILVDACTQHGYGIPFPQVVVHRAN